MKNCLVVLICKLGPQFFTWADHSVGEEGWHNHGGSVMDLCHWWVMGWWASKLTQPVEE